jgi:hypothetical protein
MELQHYFVFTDTNLRDMYTIGGPTVAAAVRIFGGIDAAGEFVSHIRPN